MERLTKRIGNTVDFANGKANLKDHQANVKLLFHRVAEYEDTGLNPDEIISLKEKLVELQNECDEWKEKMGGGRMKPTFKTRVKEWICKTFGHKHTVTISKDGIINYICKRCGKIISQSIDWSVEE